jgi:ribonuclease J
VNLVANAKLGVSTGIGLNHMNTFLMDNGFVLEFTNGKPRLLTSELDRIPVGDTFVDGLGIGDVKSDVILQRQRLGEDGIVILGATISKLHKKIVAGPDVQMRGFIFVKDSDNIMREIQAVFSQELQDDFKVQLSDKVSKILRRINGKNPIILPIILLFDEDVKLPVAA